MRTTIDIDDTLLEAAMRAGPFRTKKDAVEAGLKLLARQAAYREILKWRGKLRWEGDDSVDWTQRDAVGPRPLIAREPTPTSASAPSIPTATTRATAAPSRPRRAGR